MNDTGVSQSIPKLSEVIFLVETKGLDDNDVKRILTFYPYEKCNNIKEDITLLRRLRSKIIEKNVLLGVSKLVKKNNVN